MNILEKAAEILVESGYAIKYREDGREHLERGKYFYVYVGSNGGECGRYLDEIMCYPFSDTLNGRRQADAIEDYLRDNCRQEWHKDVFNNPPIAPYHQWRLDRIKWCLEKLTEDEK